MKIGMMKVVRMLMMMAMPVLTASAAHAQGAASGEYAVSGQVTDSLSSEPVPFATVSVAFVQEPLQYVNAVACDADGRFTLAMKLPGSYVMTVQSVGTATAVRSFVLTEAARKVDFGRLNVHAAAQTISEVTVAAQRPLVKMEIDKLIYNMEEDPEAKVNNTLDMLRKVPMVTVDGEDQIQLKGSSSFRIYMNGRPSNLLNGQNVADVLRSMPASTVKNIEVITDPGARYDAEGVGGIINIVTARNVLQGMQGSVSVSADTNGGYGGSTFLSAKTGKFGITGNFSYNDSRRPWSMQESTVENYISGDVESRTGRSNNSGVFTFGHLEASYEFDTLRLLSVGADLMNGRFNSVAERTVEKFNSAGMQEYSYKTDSDTDAEFGQTSLNVDYQRSTLRKGEYFTLSYRFNRSPNDNGNSTLASDITGDVPVRLNQRYSSDASTVEHTGQLDYVNPLTEQHTIEAGLKYILRENSSLSHQYETDAEGQWKEVPSANNDFRHISNIYAGYAGYAFKGKKFGLRTGLRAEGTQQNVEYPLDVARNFGTSYPNVVPSFTVSYQLSPAQQIRAGYNLRISRPSIWYLNPYVNDTDPYNISYGNPELKPEKSNSFNLNYSYFSQKVTLNANASYSYVNNAIESYTFIHPETEDVKRQTYDNIGRSQRTGIYVNAGWTPHRVLRLNFNGGLSYTDMKSIELAASNSGLSGNCYVNAQVTLPKDFRLNVMSMYMSRMLTLQGERSGAYITGFTANKDFLQKKLTVSLMCQSPFSRYLKFDMTTANSSFREDSIMKESLRAARISISWRFGSMKESIRKAQRGITNDDVKGGGTDNSGGSSVGGM